MAQEYRTKRSDTLDWICWRYYGRQDNRIVELVLDANPGLAENGPSLPAGWVVTLPDINVASLRKQSVRLW
ncbi:tail protein X [Kushneria sp. AK178]